MVDSNNAGHRYYDLLAVEGGIRELSHHAGDREESVTYCVKFLTFFCNGFLEYIHAMIIMNH